MVSRTTNPDRVHSNLVRADEARGKSLERLAGGKKINKASDDPTGLAMAKTLESQTRGLIQQIGIRQNEISMLQTAEGALGSVNEMVQRINELAVQASNSTLTDADRSNIQLEVDQLSAQIDQTVNNTVYNEQKLLDGSLQLKLQGGQTFAQPAATASALGLGGLSLTSTPAAGQAIDQAAQALSSLNSQRSSIGAAVKGISSQVSNLQNELVNVTAAQSRIEDVDMAAEMINLSLNELQSKAAIKAFQIKDENRQTILTLLGD